MAGIAAEAGAAQEAAGLNAPHAMLGPAAPQKQNIENNPMQRKTSPVGSLI
jgi:hypothetical protein